MLIIDTRFIKFLLCLLFFISASFANAVSLSHSASREIGKSNKYSALLLDVTKNRIYFARNSKIKRVPASLVKMMTVYILFDYIEKGKLSFNSKLTVSKYAASQAPTSLFLKPGEKISVRDAVYGLIVKSANDVAITVAENLGGTHLNFVKIMNQKAKMLGMQNTTFQNASGLPIKNQYTTAEDMAKLAIGLMKNHKKYFPLFSKKAFLFKGKLISGHNRVLKQYKNADGIKTGYVVASGFNIVSSASKPEGRLIAVVMGGQRPDITSNHAIDLLSAGYKKISKASTSQITLSNAGAIANSKSSDIFSYYSNTPQTNRTKKIKKAQNRKRIMKLVKIKKTSSKIVKKKKN